MTYIDFHNLNHIKPMAIFKALLDLSNFRQIANTKCKVYKYIALSFILLFKKDIFFTKEKSDEVNINLQELLKSLKSNRNISRIVSEIKKTKECVFLPELVDLVDQDDWLSLLHILKSANKLDCVKDALDYLKSNFKDYE